MQEMFSPKTEFRFQIGLSRHCPVNMLEKWIVSFQLICMEMKWLSQLKIQQ